MPDTSPGSREAGKSDKSDESRRIAGRKSGVKDVPKVVILAIPACKQGGFGTGPKVEKGRNRAKEQKVIKRAKRPFRHFLVILATRAQAGLNRQEPSRMSQKVA